MSIFQNLQRRFRRSGRTMRWNGLRGLTLIFILVAIMTLAILIVFSLNRLTLASNNLNRVVINLSEQALTDTTLDDIETLDTALEDVLTYMTYSRIFMMPVRPIIALVPDGRASLKRLDIAYEMALASEEMLDGLQPALYFLIADEGNPSSSRTTSGARVMELLEFGLINFDAADSHLEEASSILETVQLNRLSDRQILQYQEITAIHEQLETINRALSGSPIFIRELLGINHETSYLVLAQNNDEIRPSGGFIGSYGWMHVLNGNVNDFNYSPSDDNSPSPPRDDFAERLTIPEWWLRYQNPIVAAWDGSWHVDFSETAALAMAYYNEGDNPGAPVDAALAIDITGFEILLDVLGEVFIPESEVTVTAENFRDVVYDIRAGGQSVDAHKEFLGDVYRAIQSDWSNLPSDELPRLIEALLSALEQKHIMLYFDDANAQAVVDTLGWGGDLLETEGYDYILVADANLSGNKSNNSIQRSFSYDVNLLDDGSAEQRLAIQYDYLDRIARDDPAVNPEFHGPLLYLNRIQIFTPPTVENIGSSFASLQSFAGEDYTRHISSIQIDYDSTQRYDITYQTEDMVETTANLSHYRLLIQKQPGTRSETIDVRITLPDNSEPVFVFPETDAVYESTQVSVEYLFELESDTWIDIIYRNP